MSGCGNRENPSAHHLECAPAASASNQVGQMFFSPPATNQNHHPAVSLHATRSATPSPIPKHRTRPSIDINPAVEFSPRSRHPAISNQREFLKSFAPTRWICTRFFCPCLGLPTLVNVFCNPIRRPETHNEIVPFNHLRCVQPTRSFSTNFFAPVH